MTKFFEQSQTVDVSRITKEGWWIENTREHVAKGTALGDDYTQTIYKPGKKGMIARYDRKKDRWTDERPDRTKTPFWNQSGERFLLEKPDDDYPAWAVFEAPPEHNQKIQTALYSYERGWTLYDILIGIRYFDQWGNENVIADYNFELPQNHTFDEPPEPKEGYGVKLINGQWQQLADHREKTAYAKDRDNQAHQDYTIIELGELPDTHTLEQPKPYDSYIQDQWQYDIERHRPYKVEEEKEWRSSELAKVLNRIDQYQKDQDYPEELRTSPITNQADFLRLLQDRKCLSDYPETQDFPFAQRPELSGLAD